MHICHMDQLDVRQIRKQLNLTQRELAEEIGVNLSTVWRWENGTPPRGPARTLLLSMTEPTRPKKVRVVA